MVVTLKAMAPSTARSAAAIIKINWLNFMKLLKKAKRYLKLKSCFPLLLLKHAILSMMQVLEMLPLKYTDFTTYTAFLTYQSLLWYVKNFIIAWHNPGCDQISTSTILKLGAIPGGHKHMPGMLHQKSLRTAALDYCNTEH